MISGSIKRDATAAKTAMMYAALLLSMIVYIGAMNAILAPASRPLGLLGGAYSIGLIFTHDHSKRVAAACWPLFAMAAIAWSSVLWSTNPTLTMQHALLLTFSMTTGVAAVGRLGAVGAIKLIIQVMSIICVLSVIWAFAFPELGLHQASDNYQSVHAGLWRGVLSHKVSLGVFAGLTLGLLLFYGWKAVRHPLLYVVAVTAAVACLLGSGSATGLVGGAAIGGASFTAHWIATWDRSLRKLAVRWLLVFTIVALLAVHSGGVNQLAVLLGKQPDLTGRTGYWPHVLSVVDNGSFLVGYGYGAGFRSLSRILEALSGTLLFEGHNGILDMLVAFGYLGTIVIAALFLSIFVRSIRQIITCHRPTAKVAVFLYAVLTTTFVLSYAESVILVSVGIYTLILSVAIACAACVQIEQRRQRAQAKYSALMYAKRLYAQRGRRPAPDTLIDAI